MLLLKVHIFCRLLRTHAQTHFNIVHLYLYNLPFSVNIFKFINVFTGELSF